MATSFREKNRDPGWFAAFWRAFSSPSFAGVAMFFAAAAIMSAGFVDDSGLVVVGRVLVIIASGSLIATVLSVALHARYFGRASTALGLDRRVSVPLFREELPAEEVSTSGRRMSVLLRLAFLTIATGAPLAMAAMMFFDSSLPGEVVVTTDESVESVSVSLGGSHVNRDIAMNLALGADVHVNEGRAELAVTNRSTMETKRPILRVGERLHMNAEYVALHGWRPTLSTRSAVLEIISQSGDVQREARLQNGAELVLDGGATLELIESRDAFLELLGPAAHLRLTSASGEVREFWTFTRAPDFDLRHGSGTERVRLVGFEPGVSAVVSVRNSAGQRWDLWALVLFGAMTLLLFGRSLSSGFLTGHSGDYLYVGASPWFFATDIGEADRDEFEKSLARNVTETTERANATSEDA